MLFPKQYTWYVATFLLLLLGPESKGDECWKLLRITHHAKAPELDFSIKYPPDRKIGEGNRPHIVKKLSNGNQIFLILATKFPKKISKEEADGMFSQNDIKELMPNGAHLDACRRTTLEGQTAWIMLYSQQEERLGKKIATITVACMVIYQDYLLQMQSIYAFSPEELSKIPKSPELQEKYKQFILNSMKMFNTFIIYNRYG